MDKDYEGVTTQWIMCGTATLRSLTLLSEKQCADLGKRFMECVIDEKETDGPCSL